MQAQHDNSPAVLRFTEKAKSAILRMQEELNVPEDHFLRVGIRGGGCGVTSYILGFDQVREKDQRYDVDGLQVLMEMGQAMYVMGMEIDYVENEEQRGFVFNNPQARATSEKGE